MWDGRYKINATWDDAQMLINYRVRTIYSRDNVSYLSYDFFLNGPTDNFVMAVHPFEGQEDSHISHHRVIH